MSDIIQFPNQADAYFRKGKQAAEQLHYHKALDYFIQSYTISNSSQALAECLALFLFLDQREELFQFIEDYDIQPESFTENEELATFYVTICSLKTASASTVMELLRFKQLMSDNDKMTSIIDRSIQQIDKAIQLTDKISKFIEDKEFSQLSQKMQTLSAKQQLEWCDILYDFPIDKTIILFKELLVSKEIPSYVKATILEHLIDESVDETINYLWFNTKKKVDISKTSLLKDIPIYQKSIEYIYNQSQMEHPHMTNELIQQFYYYATSFYPFIDEILESPMDWYQAYLSFHQLSVSEEEIPDILLNYLQLALKEYTLY